MKLLRGLHNLPSNPQGCVLSIGNYDGVHLGHQALLAHLCQQARALGLPATVMMFEPSPREFFAPAHAPVRVLTLRNKLAALAQFGVQQVVLLRFNAALAQLTAVEFVEKILVQALAVKAIVIGDDFRFGAQRSGDFALLQRLGAQHGFSAQALGTTTVGGLRCSSTALRAALAAAQLDKAQQLLGRPFRISGRVRHGHKLARELAMPTANLPLHRHPPLPLGVYAVRCTVNGLSSPGVAAVGVRPSIGGTPCLLEAHLFDTSADLYGQLLHVDFVNFLRPEAHFASLQLLKDQMHADAHQARTLLNPHG